MATIDRTGVRVKSLSEHIAELVAAYRALFGEDLVLDSETAEMQIIGIMAARLVEIDQTIARLGAATDVNRADLVLLDNLGTLLGIERRPALHSEVTATLTGVAGTQVPAGSRAKTAEDDEFETLQAVLLSPTGVDVSMQSVETGAIMAGPGALDTIVTLVPGWESVTNTEAAVPGRPQQNDQDFRDRFKLRTAIHARGTISAIQAALEAAGADVINVQENPANSSSTVQGWTLAPHALLVIVGGGTETNLKRSLTAYRGQGVPLMSAVRGSTIQVADLNSITNGTVTYGGNDYPGLNLSAATTGTEVVTALNTLLADVNVWFSWDYNQYLTATMPWDVNGNQLAFGNNATVTALGLANGVPNQCYVRPVERPLVITMTVDVNVDLFPPGGVEQIRTALLNRVQVYGVGEQVWIGDFRSAVETIAGTRVTATTIQENGRDISGVAVPPDVRWTLQLSDLTLTFTGI